MSWSRLFRACLAAFALLFALVAAGVSVQAQTNIDRPGGDYLRSLSLSGDPADCALLCEHDRRCRAWSFNYPSDRSETAICWLKNSVPPRVASSCCVSGVRGAGVIEPRTGPVETSIDRFGGDYRNFEVKNEEKSEKSEKGEKSEKAEKEQACREACQADNKCRAWTYARPGYVGREARCFLKKEIKPPRRKPGFISGVVR